VHIAFLALDRILRCIERLWCRLSCSGGSDAYCAKCENTCVRFNKDASSSEIPLGLCLETSTESSVSSAIAPEACNPNTAPFTCAYTSEGTPGKATSDCQIETCCKDCVNTEEAVAKGKATVCLGSTAGLKEPEGMAYVIFLGEVPMNMKRFNTVAKDYAEAIQSLAGAKRVTIEYLQDFKMCNLRRDAVWDPEAQYCIYDERHHAMRKDGDEEWATVADFRCLFMHVYFATHMLSHAHLVHLVTY